MIFLATDFSPIKPDFGLLFWATLIFLLFWGLVGKLAFKPIAKALKERSDSIDEALRSADKAREEMAHLQAQNEVILQEAREERSRVLREANEAKTRIINEAKEDAKTEASKIVEDAKKEINSQKRAAINEVKSDVGKIAVEIAEKVLNRELNAKQDQEALVSSILDNVDFSKN